MRRARGDARNVREAKELDFMIDEGAAPSSFGVRIADDARRGEFT